MIFKSSILQNIFDIANKTSDTIGTSILERLGIRDKPRQVFKIGEGLTSKQKEKAERLVRREPFGFEPEPKIKRPSMFLTKEEYERRMTGKIPQEDIKEITRMRQERITDLAYGMAGIAPKKQIIKKLTPKIKEITKPFVRKFQQPVRSQMKKVIPELQEDIMKTRRGILNDKDIFKLARGEIKVLDKVAELPKGSILNAEKSLAMRQELADKFLEATTGKEALKIGEKYLPKTLGVRAETGRALRSYSQVIGKEKEVIEKLINMANKETNKKIAGALREKARLIGMAKEPKFIDKLVEWGTAIKLTNPITQVRNMGGNTFMTMLKYPEKLFTCGIDSIRAGITRTPKQRFAREAISDMYGTVSGFKEGARMALKALTNERVAIGERRIEEATPFIEGAIKGKFGKVVRMPFRPLTAGDLFFRTANRQGSLYSLATRKAMQKGYTGVNLVKKIEEYAKNPSDNMLKTAEKEAKRLVFQSDLTGIWKSLNAGRNKHPITKLILPFFKTPANIFKSIIQRTPLAPLSSEMREMVQMGGGEASEALGRMLTGSALISSLMFFALEGTITGRGPAKKNEKDALYRQGWQPNSIKAGNKYYSYSGFEPLTAYLNFAADTVETMEEPSEQKATEILTAITKDFTNQPFLIGLSGLVDALEDEKKLSRFMQSFATGMTIPTGISFFARIQDPVYRKSEGILEKFESKLPFLSEKLQPKLNVWGKEVKREGQFPTYITTEKYDALEDELTRLNKTIGYVSATAFATKLSKEQHETLQRVSGQVSYDILIEIIETSDYKKLKDYDKDKLIDKVIEKVRRRIREKAFEELRIKRELKTRLIKRGQTEENAKRIADEIYLKEF